jgi:hypothetical protein
MFAKTQKFRSTSLQTGRPPATLTPSNDNRIDTRGAAHPRRTRRPILVCRWQPIGDGRLECHWNIEPADGKVIEEPDSRWLLGRNGRSFGIEAASGRLALLATG